MNPLEYEKVESNPFVNAINNRLLILRNIYAILLINLFLILNFEKSESDNKQDLRVYNSLRLNELMNLIYRKYVRLRSPIKDNILIQAQVIPESEHLAIIEITKRRVAVSSDFMDLSYREQNFVLAHELAHYEQFLAGNDLGLKYEHCYRFYETYLSNIYCFIADLSFYNLLKKLIFIIIFPYICPLTGRNLMLIGLSELTALHILKTIFQLTFCYISRTNEIEADQRAVKVLKSSVGAIKFFHRIDDDNILVHLESQNQSFCAFWYRKLIVFQNGILSAIKKIFYFSWIFETHPESQDRIDYIKNNF